MRPLTLNQLMREQFGFVPVTMRQRSRTSITQTITQFLPQNPARIAFWCTNGGFDIGLINEDQNDLILKRGIQLVPGGTVSFWWFEDFDLVTLPWFGLNLRGTPNITALYDVCEVILIGDRDEFIGEVQK